MANSEDAQHLQWLSIAHYIVGGLSALCSCIPVIHLIVGIVMVSGGFPDQGKNGPPPAAFGWFFIVIAATAIVLGWAYSIGLMVAGWQLQKRRGYVFCLVMAALSCLNMPIGTCLGVFTIVVLTRTTVRALFDRAKKGHRAWDPEI